MGEDGGHHLDGVVEGDEIDGQVVRRAVLEHGQHARQHHHQHEGHHHGAGVLHVFGQSRDEADGGRHDEHRGEDDQQEGDVVGGGVVEGHVEASGVGVNHLGQREGYADEAGDAAEEGDAAEGDNLAEGQLVAVHGCDEESGDGAAFLLAGDGAGGDGHGAAEEHHDDNHGENLAPDVAHHVVDGGLVEAGLGAVGAVDVEEVGVQVLIGGERLLQGGVDARGGVVGRVVVDFDVGCREAVGGGVGGDERVEPFGEAHEDGVDFLVAEGVDVGLEDSLLHDGRGAVHLVDGGGEALGHILDREGHHLAAALVDHVADAGAHEAVYNIDKQARHDDGGEEHLPVAEEAGEFFADDGPSVVVSHCSSPFTVL